MDNKGKGVIVKVVPDEMMPVDANGTRADIVMDNGSTISRMNVGRLQEQYVGAACWQVTYNIRKMANITKLTLSDVRKQITSMYNTNLQLFQEIYNYVLGFLELVSPKQFIYYRDRLSNEEKIDWIVHTMVKGLYLFYPIGNEIEHTQVIRNIQSKYPPVYGPVSYIDNSGKKVTTHENIRIAPLYIMLLEKIADDWSSTSSGKLQALGVLTPATKSDKHSTPSRNTPVRTVGETEGRIFAGYCGREAIAEQMDRNNSPATHRYIYKTILNAEKPGNIPDAVNREHIPLGGIKPMQLINSISICAGWMSVYEPE